MALLFALLFWGELAGSIRNSTHAKMDDFESSLKQIVLTEEPAAKGAGGLQSMAEEDPKADLRSLEAQLAAQTKLDNLGREIDAAVLTEEKKSVPASVYGPLLHSASPEAQAYGRIYEPGKLSLQDARSLVKRLAANKDFVAKLASVQALEKAGDRTARNKLLPASSGLFMAILPYALLGLIGASVFVWFAYFALRSSGELRPEGMLNRALSGIQADLFAVRAAQLFCGWLLIGLLCRSVFGGSEETNAPAMFAQGFAMLAFVPLLFKFPLGQGLPTLAELGVTKEKLGRNILWGVAGFLAELPVAMILSELVMMLFRFLPTPQHPAEHELQQTTNPLTVAAILFLGTIVAAFWEEIVFRGLLFPALSRICKSIPVGALASSFVFASIHPQGAAVWPSLCVVGLMSCALSYQTRSLVPSMVMHFCHNAVLLVLTIQWSGG